MVEMVNLKFRQEIKSKITHFDHDHAMTMAKIQISVVKMVKIDLTTKIEHKMTVLTIDHGGKSRVSVVVVKFFDH